MLTRKEWTIVVLVAVALVIAVVCWYLYLEGFRICTTGIYYTNADVLGMHFNTAHIHVENYDQFMNLLRK